MLILHSMDLVKEVMGGRIEYGFRHKSRLLSAGLSLLLSTMAKYESDLSAIFQALSDPTRRAILEQLGKGAVAVSELARPTGLALPTVMRHLAVLEGAALIETTKTGRTRMCSARPEAIAATQDWLSAQKREWEARTDRLQAYVETLMLEAKNED
ncbi:MAG: hypothetical protein RIR95_1018 [Pseudomonadota bacterium]